MSRRIGWMLFGVFVLLSVLSMVQVAEADTRGIKVKARDKSTGQQEEIRLYRQMIAVIIGIDRYPNLSYDHQLSYAVSDAKAVERTLQERFQFDQIYTLYNEQATKEAIVELLEGTLAKTDREDAVFVFFAGHAITEKTEFGEVGYLVPYDGTFKRDELYRNLSMTQIKHDISRRIRAKHVFYVVDACYGGLLLALRGSDRETGHDLGYLREMTREPVRQVLTAGSKDQPVLDGGPKGHSVFTGRLIEALERATDYVTAGELSERIKRKVYSDAQARGHVQTPQDGALFGTGDFVFVPKAVVSSQPDVEIEKQQQEKQQKEAEIEPLRQELGAEKARHEPEPKAKAKEIAESILGGTVHEAIPYMDKDYIQRIAVRHRESDVAGDHKVMILEKWANTYRVAWQSDLLHGRPVAGHFGVDDVNNDGMHEVYFGERSFGSSGGSRDLHLYVPVRKEIFTVSWWFYQKDSQIELSPNVSDPKNSVFRQWLEKKAAGLGIIPLMKKRDLDDPKHAEARWIKENGYKKKGKIKIHTYRGSKDSAGESSKNSIIAEILYGGLQYVSYFRGAVYCFNPREGTFFVVYVSKDIYEWVEELSVKKGKIALDMSMRGGGVIYFDPNTLTLSERP